MVAVKVLVCGGRDFADKSLVDATLDKVFAKYGDELVIVTGAQRKRVGERYVGADYLAEEWAKSREVPYMGFPAQWTKMGKAAGPERNRRMRDEAKPDACVAFEGGTGTAGMCQLMEEIGIKPWKVGW
jgi:hypothetical protein